MSTATDLDVIVIGAGFAGLYQLMELRDAGFKVRVYDNAAQIGGIWYWNCYPGARVDSTAPLYQYSREDLWRDWTYSELFPSWKEIRAYFAYVDKKLNLSKDIRLSTRIESAKFSEKTNLWTIRTDKGDVACAKHIVICSGFASKPLMPDIDGLGSFSGPVAHAGRWPQEGVSFEGRRIGVIGTGSSGVQMSEQASLTAQHLTVFQRTPALALPLRQRRIDPATAKEMKADFPRIMDLRRNTFAGFDYEFTTKSWGDFNAEQREAFFEVLWGEGAFHPWLGNFMDVILREDASAEAYAFWRRKVHARVKDPVLAEKLAPAKAPIFYGTKRMGLEQWYFEIFNKPNVELIDIKENPIERVLPNGIQTRDKFVELDVILLGTGFDAVTGGIPSIDIRGLGDRSIADYWSKGFRTVYGTAASGFPNLFFIYGPQSPAAWSNGPSLAEYQGQWVVECISYMRDHKLVRIDATRQAEEDWSKSVKEIASHTLLPRTRSWWFGGNIPGRELEPLYYAGGLPRYLQEIGDAAKRGYARGRAEIGRLR